MKKVGLTMQEIWMATRPLIEKSKKKYTRKSKHKKKGHCNDGLSSFIT